MRQWQARVGQSVWIAFATIGMILGGWQAAAAQEQKIDVNGIVRDTQQVSNEGGEFNIAWWLPDEFWKASLAAKPGATTPAQQETLIKVVHPYFIIGIISGKSGAFGAMTYRTEAEVRAMLQLKDSEGNIYKPLADDKVDGSVPALLGLMKPGMARMMGPWARISISIFLRVRTRMGQGSTIHSGMARLKWIWGTAYLNGGCRWTPWCRNRSARLAARR